MFRTNNCYHQEIFTGSLQFLPCWCYVKIVWIGIE